LLSIGKITDNGYHVIREKVVVLDNEENVILTAERKDDLYFTSERAEFAESVSTRQSDDNLRLWHVRLGHLNEKYLKSMQARGILKFNSKGEKSIDRCETCLKGKIIRLSFQNSCNRRKIC